MKNKMDCKNLRLAQSKKNARSGIVWVVRLINLLLLVNMLYLKYVDQRGGINYLIDPFNLGLMLSAICLNLAYWSLLGREYVGVVFTSGGALQSAMRKVAEEMSEKTFFFVKPVPSARALEKHAVSIFSERENIFVNRKIELIFLAMRVKNLFSMNCLAIFISAIGLWFGEAFNYSKAIKAVWFVVPLLMYVIMNILIYSTSIVLFFTWRKIFRSSNALSGF